MEFIVPVWWYRRGDGEQPRSTDAHATPATPLRNCPDCGWSSRGAVSAVTR